MGNHGKVLAALWRSYKLCSMDALVEYKKSNGQIRLKMNILGKDRDRANRVYFRKSQIEMDWVYSAKKP